MKKPKLNVNKLTKLQKVQLAQMIKTKMTGNPSFTNPLPTLVVLGSGADDLNTKNNTAIAARAVGVAATMAADAAETTLNDTLTQLAAYVSNMAKGDATMIMSAGMEVTSSPSPVQPVDAPVLQSMANGAMPGTMVIKWKRVRGAKSFSVEKCLDPVTADGWSNGDTATKITATVSGLIPGKLYWFRVAGVGAMGKGPFSEPMSRWAI